MLLPDSNIWLAIAIEGHKDRPVIDAWLRDNLARRKLLFCRPTEQSLLRLLTQASVFKAVDRPPLTNSEAIQAYRLLRRESFIGFARETRDIEKKWFEYGRHYTPAPNLWMDAYLAAFASTGHYHLLTFDNDYHQFKGLNCTILTKP